ncbi:TetR/AcrR family transcriptional regulator [Plantactinospora sp. KBS50]|uniref:TetR/AcrR family transcriptional regulator n=1 Tax=Plantactinospora sp. KBS50 TaxID=2024580 RepID=UPI000BAAE63B|nr:TetR/AcrR family transcriptional regulator [Plantactinospora sp. KBS50]ASW56145.1 TetR family transcriptional regulator [Plantactinospora sp. KBS50]
MSQPDQPAPGLRERKKQATRAALSWAAVQLAVERGLDNVRVEDIAEAAGVSPRTFNNYFGSKAEAIAARHTERLREIAAETAGRPAGEPIWTAVTAAVAARFDNDRTDPDPQWLAGVRLMTSEPSLQGELVKAHVAAEAELVAVLARRTGTDPVRDLYPRLLAGAIGAAIQAATAQWLNADPRVPIGLLVRDALTQLAAGLPAPRLAPRLEP